MLAFIFLTAAYVWYVFSVLGFEGIQAEDIAPFSQGKAHVKGGQPKQKTGKRHGYVYGEKFLFLIS